MTWFESRKAQKINLILSAFMYEFEEGAGSKKIWAGSNFRLEKKFDPARKKFKPAQKKFKKLFQIKSLNYVLL